MIGWSELCTCMSKIKGLNESPFTKREVIHLTYGS
ncbi:unnamed protein product [Arabidopsis halleri]